MSDEEWSKIPKEHQETLDRNTPVKRSVIQTLDMPIFSKVTNRVDVIFEDAKPKVEGQ